MKFLIPTEPDDTHAILVKLALEKKGHDVRFLFTADQPTKLKNTVLIDNDTYQWRSTDKSDSFVDNDYDVVWWRRARKPYLPKDCAHPSDYDFVVRENHLFYESITNTISPHARWINDKSAATRSHAKLLQLKLAVECGLAIPTTLFSNDPQDIRYFLLRHEREGVIYKPHCSNFWFEEQRMRISYTTPISFLELPNNQALQLTPGIFQKEIKKQYELRITYFGGYMVAAKLDSQAHVDGKVDWRAISGRRLTIEPYILPESLAHKIQVLMKKMGLVFGALDFIKSEEDEYIFLEVNEQGQFLWKEELNSEFQMLDIFTQFLLSRSSSFQWEPKKWEHSIEDYQYQVGPLVAQNREQHIGLNTAKTYNA